MTPIEFTRRMAIIAMAPEPVPARQARRVALMERALFENGFGAGIDAWRDAMEAEGVVEPNHGAGDADGATAHFT